MHHLASCFLPREVDPWRPPVPDCKKLLGCHRSSSCNSSTTVLRARPSAGEAAPPEPPAEATVDLGQAAAGSACLCKGRQVGNGLTSRGALCKPLRKGPTDLQGAQSLPGIDFRTKKRRAIATGARTLVPARYRQATINTTNDAVEMLLQSGWMRGVRSPARRTGRTP